jgi:outer membrane protein TolC
MFDRRSRAVLFAVCAAVCALATSSRAEVSEAITYDDALSRARARSPDLAAARAREGVANAEIGIAGLAPNPMVSGGTNTQTAKLSGSLSVPLVILGQRGAAENASSAELATVRVETAVAWNDVRASTARAFVGLWLAENTATVRDESARLVKKLEDAVMGRIAVGSAPEVEGLRVRAERLRADADAEEAHWRVAGAGGELGRWIGATSEVIFHAVGEPRTPDQAAPLASLAANLASVPSVRRELADALAARARADRERAFVRPAMTLDVGFDAFDPTLPATNYHAQLGVEVPLFHQRGPFIEREVMAERAARARAEAERAHFAADLLVAYRAFEATTARKRALEEGVVPAAEAAANATQESYILGHAPLLTVLDAERARLDAHLSALEARAARALAWIDVERAIGVP